MKESYPKNLKGMKRHGRSGHTVNCNHFTGTKVGKKIRRKGPTRKQRKLKMHTHTNKYAKYSKALQLKDKK